MLLPPSPLCPTILEGGKEGSNKKMQNKVLFCHRALEKDFSLRKKGPFFASARPK